ncbi:Metallo-dependent hydrolase [Agrocybe pediades]|nr:Metallo-dependent hydrolase [Agrocybe pediades]
MAQKGCPNATVVHLKDGQFIIPGFIDTHIHAPQVPDMGTGGQYVLLDWLKKIVFPSESRYEDTDFAEKTYNSVIRRTIDCGTTTACYFGSLHFEATKILAKVVHDHGQRAFVGKCNMDRKDDPKQTYFEDSTEDSLNQTKELISYIRGLSKHSHDKHNGLVQPILTPRFALSCTKKMLRALGDIAEKDEDLRIQTHLAENTGEVDKVAEVYPERDSYTDVYDHFGLLTKKTILAHAVHLKKDEIDLIKKRDAGISHCPSSNFNLNSGIAPVGVYLDKGIKVGLGTDVSGGYHLSMLGVIQNANIGAKVYAMQAPTYDRYSLKAAHNPENSFSNQPLSIATLLYLATMGGAEVCDLAHQIGSFAVRKSFDALVVDVRDGAGNIGIWARVEDYSSHHSHHDLKKKKEMLEVWLEKFFLCGDDRNISRVKKMKIWIPLHQLAQVV